MERLGNEGIRASIPQTYITNIIPSFSGKDTNTRDFNCKNLLHTSQKAIHFPLHIAIVEIPWVCWRRRELCNEKDADTHANQPSMSHPPAKSHSSKTRTTTSSVHKYETVLIEPPKKLSPKNGPTKTRDTSIIKREYNTVLIEPPKKPRTTGQWTKKKKATTSKKETNGKATTPAVLHTKKIKSHLDVIRIPCHGPPFHITRLPLITIGNGGMKPEDCVPGEEWLVQFPNMYSLAHEPQFNYRQRRLIGIPANDLSTSVKETYLMYVCYEETAGMPHNRYLEDLSGFNMFGESFLFKMEEDFGGDGKPVFRDMGAESARELESGGLLEAVVRKLLNSMTGKRDEGKG